MTFVLQTLSHGNLESGFLMSYTSMLRIGDHAMSTRHFCEATKFIADNPQVKEIKLMCCKLADFESKFDEHITGYTGQIFSLLNQGRGPATDQKRIQFELSAWKMAEQDKEITVSGWEGLTLQINPAAKEVKAGEYVIGFDQFAFFSWYIIRGGWFGWPEKSYPDYATEALRSINGSENELYASLRGKVKMENPNVN